MRTSPTYQYYVDSYHGQLGEDEFISAVIDAQALVNHIIGMNVVEANTQAAYKNAICAAVDKMVEYGDGSSVSIGSFSIGASANDGEDTARASAMMHLSGSGLLWSGV